MRTKRVLLTALTLLISTCAIAQTTLPIVGSDDPIDHWRVTIWSVGDSVETDVEVSAGGSVLLSWLQPLFSVADPGDTIETLPSGDVAKFFGVYVSEIGLTLFGVDSANAEHRVYNLLLFPGTYSLSVRAHTVGGRHSIFKSFSSFRVVADPDQQFPPMAPVQIKIIIGG